MAGERGLGRRAAAAESARTQHAPRGVRDRDQYGAARSRLRLERRGATLASMSSASGRGGRPVPLTLVPRLIDPSDELARGVRALAARRNVLTRAFVVGPGRGVAAVPRASKRGDKLRAEVTSFGGGPARERASNVDDPRSRDQTSLPRAPLASSDAACAFARRPPRPPGGHRGRSPRAWRSARTRELERILRGGGGRLLRSSTPVALPRRWLPGPRAPPTPTSAATTSVSASRRRRLVDTKSVEPGSAAALSRALIARPRGLAAVTRSGTSKRAARRASRRAPRRSARRANDGQVARRLRRAMLFASLPRPAPPVLAVEPTASPLQIPVTTNRPPGPVGADARRRTASSSPPESPRSSASGPSAFAPSPLVVAPLASGWRVAARKHGRRPSKSAARDAARAPAARRAMTFGRRSRFGIGRVVRRRTRRGRGDEGGARTVDRSHYARRALVAGKRRRKASGVKTLSSSWRVVEVTPRSRHRRVPPRPWHGAERHGVLAPRSARGRGGRDSAQR